MLGIMVNILSMSKSPPDLATISAGRITMLPASSGKNSYTSMNSMELRPCTGIRAAVIVIRSLLLDPIKSTGVTSTNCFAPPAIYASN